MKIALFPNIGRGLLIALALSGCNTSLAGGEASTQRLAVTAIGPQQQALALDSLHWWTLAAPGRVHHAVCARDRCAEWQFDVPVDEQIVLQGNREIVATDDPACTDTWHGTVTVTAAQDSVTLLVDKTSRVCR